MTIKPTQGDLEAAAAYVAVSFGPRYRKSVMQGSGWTQLTEAFALRAQAARIEGARAMQEAAAKACEDQRLAFFSPEYATDQPLSSFSERFACGLLIGIIEHLDPQTIAGEAG